jgi:hypothetical protein
MVSNIKNRFRVCTIQYNKNLNQHYTKLLNNAEIVYRKNDYDFIRSMMRANNANNHLMYNIKGILYE